MFCAACLSMPYKPPKYHGLKKKFSIKYFFSKCDQTADLVKFIEEILNGKLLFLCSVSGSRYAIKFKLTPVISLDK